MKYQGWVDIYGTYRRGTPEYPDVASLGTNQLAVCDSEGKFDHYTSIVDGASVNLGERFEFLNIRVPLLILPGVWRMKRRKGSKQELREAAGAVVDAIEGQLHHLRDFLFEGKRNRRIHLGRNLRELLDANPDLHLEMQDRTPRDWVQWTPRMP